MNGLDIIPAGNEVDVLLSNLTQAKGGSAITDAQLVVNVLDGSCNLVIGPIAMTAEATPSTGINNSYRASFDSTPLTQNATYLVQVSGQNYTVEWEGWLPCLPRSFSE